MLNSLSRRSLLLTIGAAAFAGSCRPLFAAAQQVKPISIQEKLAKIETEAKGRIGLSATNTANNTRIQYRANERFPLCSTFKLMLVSAVLKQSMIKGDLLRQHIVFTEEKLISWSPITEKRVADGMSVSELCAAALQYSDNTAANLLIRLLDGPEAVTRFARSIGDDAFRLDRWEPELNSAVPGDLRDTTTPAAMEKSLQRLALGDILTPELREQLQIWLKGNTTGKASIRAGVPKGWIVGDKTGSGSYGSTNDIAVLWPPERAPVIVAIYFTQNEKNAPARRDVLAAATKALISEL